MNNICKETLEVVDNMSVYISDSIVNTRCIRFYYNISDVIRNRGNITLLYPYYCDCLSSISKLIFKNVKNKMEWR